MAENNNNRWQEKNTEATTQTHGQQTKQKTGQPCNCHGPNCKYNEDQE